MVRFEPTLYKYKTPNRVSSEKCPGRISPGHYQHISLKN